MDAALDAGRYAAGDGVGRGRSQGAGLPQTLLIPQLEKNTDLTLKRLKNDALWCNLTLYVQNLWHAVTPNGK